jgi:hypothetical protein
MGGAGMRGHGSSELTPPTFLLLIVAGISGALLWQVPGALGVELPAGDRDTDSCLLGLVAPGPARAASGLRGLADLASLDPAGGDSLAETPPVWREIPPAVRLGHSAVFDAARKRMVVFGGLDGEDFTNKTWVLVPGPVPTWDLLTSQPPDPIDYTLADSIRRPSPRTGHATVLVEDHGQERLLVIGGFGVGGPRRDVWALDVTAGDEKWTQFFPDADPTAVPDTLPTPRSGHTAVYDYDAERHRVLVFGGIADSLDILDDAWELDLDKEPWKWTKLVIVGAAGSNLLPRARFGHSAVYDPDRDRVLVFGGIADSLGVPDEGHEREFEFLNDSWALSLPDTSYTLLCERIEPEAGETPPPRGRHAAVLDARHQRMLVFAGVTRGSYLDFAGVTRGSYLDDLWELSLGPNPVWRSIRPTGDVPSGRPVPSAAIDAPSGRMGPAAVVDAPHDRMLVFGGSRGAYDFNDTWALPLGGRGTPKWTLVSPPEGDPHARLGHAAVYDSRRGRDRMLMVGGFDGSAPLIDVWELPFSGQMSWRQLRIQGEAPQGRSGHTVVYDPDGDRLLVFGGLNFVYLDDLWQLPLGEAPGQQRWTRLFPESGPPPGRADHTAIYDTRRKRIVVFGGVGNAGRTNDAWVLSLGEKLTWKRLAVGDTLDSVGRSAHVAVYDSLYDRMVVWGGTTSDGSTPDARELCFGGPGPDSCGPNAPTWKRLATRGTAPPWQFGQSAVCDYDPNGGRMVLFGGGFQEGRRLEFGDQVYELTLRDTCAWRLIEPTGPRPRTRVGHSAIYDTLRNRMVVYGGGRLGKPPRSYCADLWTLTWDAANTQGSVVETGPPGRPGSGDDPGDSDILPLALASAQPNPTHGEATVVFTLPGDDVARIEIVDVRGRRVHARDLGALGPGTHTLRIAERGGLAAGVYLVRLSYGARTLTGKMAVLR